MADFDNKVVIVTGGASGIGLACARLFAEMGARVVISDVADDKGEAAVASIGQVDNAVYRHCDVSQPQEVEALVRFAVDTYGGLHAIVNNAGIGGASAPTAEYPLDSWDRVIAINLSGVFYGTKYAIPAILESGGGAVCNIASILGTVGFDQAVAYVSAKHGVVGLTKVAAMEYAAQGIRVNAVGPAFIKTPLLDPILADANTAEYLTGLHPIGRMGESCEVAELVVWLCSDRASFCTGTYYPVDGGYLAR